MSTEREEESGMSEMETDWTACSDPPEESCSDAGCPVHGGDKCPDCGRAECTGVAAGPEGAPS
jgi:hypothetical protein